MATHDEEIKRTIKQLEAYEFKKSFPEELTAYLYDQYREDPWPYTFSEGDIYSGIRADARAYFMGKLDISIKSPLMKARVEIHFLRYLYSKAMCDIRELESQIEECEKKKRRTYDESKL